MTAPYARAVELGLFPDLGDYCHPERGPNLELLYLSRRLGEQSVYPQRTIDAYKAAAVEYFSTIPQQELPPWLKSIDAMCGARAFFEQSSGVRRDASPGYPASLVYSTKADVLKNPADVCLALAARIRLLSSHPVLPEDPLQLVLDGYTDPYQLLLKNETRKRLKDTRIVLQASVLSEMIERLLYSTISSYFLDNWGDHGSMPGLSFDEEGHRRLFEGLDEVVFTSDFPRFDYTVNAGEEESNCLGLMSLYSPAPPDDVARCAINHSHCTMRKLMVAGGGHLIAQTLPGIQAPGRWMTTRFNTITRIIRGMVVAKSLGVERPLVKANGDDAVENCGGVDLTRAYLSHGYVLRDGVVCDREVEFCSHLWKREGGLPVAQRLTKATATLLLSTDKRSQRLLGFYDSFENNPKFDESLSLLYLSGW